MDLWLLFRPKLFELFCGILSWQYAAIIKINTSNMMSLGHKSVTEMCEVMLMCF